MILRSVGHGVIIVVLTLLTQVGGLAWLSALLFRRRSVAFLLIYATLWAVSFATAPLAGRVALPCFGETLRMQSAFYCITSRHYVTPEMRDVAQSAAEHMASEFPGTQTLALDGSFPFFDGFPLIPHLSHDDGEKLDFAFFYTTPDGKYQPGLTRSLIGYWAFEALEDDTCPEVSLTLRWDLRWLQRFWREAPLEPLRTAELIRHLSANDQVAKIFVEPALADQLALSQPKLRFQGCRAARHDDHIHFQL